MSRNLRLMETNRWIELDSTEDRRERRYRLTPAEEKLLSAAKPGWMRAQAKLRAALKSGNGKPCRLFSAGLPKLRLRHSKPQPGNPESDP
jgi:DNA-binding MarR family transcriptional regulator